MALPNDPTPHPPPSGPREHPLADPVLDVLLVQADAARRFEEDVLLASRSAERPASAPRELVAQEMARRPDVLASVGSALDHDGLGHQEHDALVSQPLPHRSAIAWRTARWAGLGLAAAASLVVGAGLFLQQSPKPAPTTPGQPPALATRTTAPTASQDSAPRVVATSATSSDLASDLERFAYLDEGIDGPGLPTLTGERELVMAIRTSADHDQSCKCVGWSVGDPGSTASLKTRVLQQTLGSGCGTTLNDIVLVRVTGPRNELPMHDEEARDWAACISDAPKFCAAAVKPDQPLGDQEVCTQTVAMGCIPQGLDLIITPLAFAGP